MDLYILDSYSLMYTSFFAGGYTGLTSPSGEPTYGTFIFTKTILRILDTYLPDMICCAVDGPDKTFRKKMYPEYKNNRKKEKPQDLFVQVDRMKQILEAMGFPIYYAPGFEADDVIATIVKRADPSFLITICTKDKDLLQLTDEGNRINILDPYKNTRMYVEEVKKKYNIEASQFVDYLGLIGDSSDNIPGIKGVGPKTAVKFLNKHKTGDKIFENLCEQKNLSNAELKILKGYDDFVLSRSLATLKDDIDMKIDFDGMKRKPLKWDKLDPIFEELGFDSLLT